MGCRGASSRLPFFFSSRRRHTRCGRDWSSDVCSSDLTYATWWIRQAIARGAADRGVRAIRLPVHMDEQVGRLRRTQARLLELLGREPTDGELAEVLDMPVHKVDRLKEIAQAITSLDTPIGDDGAALQDFLED